jgi:hypothetical protein
MAYINFATIVLICVHYVNTDREQDQSMFPIKVPFLAQAHKYKLSYKDVHHPKYQSNYKKRSINGKSFKNYNQKASQYLIIIQQQKRMKKKINLKIALLSNDKKNAFFKDIINLQTTFFFNFKFFSILSEMSSATRLISSPLITVEILKNLLDSNDFFNENYRLLDVNIGPKPKEKYNA